MRMYMKRTMMGGRVFEEEILKYISSALIN
jgi:hypothetical protein